VAREHRGVVRAAQELGHVGTAESELRHQLREIAGVAVNAQLDQTLGKPISRAAALVVADIVAQYVLMESAGWIPKRDTRAVATELERLVKKGLYKK